MLYRRSQARDAVRAQFRGVGAAITTPFTRIGAFDGAGRRAGFQVI